MVNQNPVTDSHVGTSPTYDWPDSHYREVRQQAGLPAGWEPSKRYKKARRKEDTRPVPDDFLVGTYLVCVVQDIKGFLNHFYCEILDVVDERVFVIIHKSEHEKYQYKVGHIDILIMEWFEDRRSRWYWSGHFYDLHPTEKSKSEFGW